MRGLIKPCRHHLGREEYQQWRSHLCGLCLSLRDHTGAASRLLTGYDVLLPSVLVEAQTGRLPTRTAGPCALRGGMPAEVIRSDTDAAKFGVAAAVLVGASGLADKVQDKDLPVVARPIAQRAAVTLTRKGARMAEQSGFDANEVLSRVDAAVAAENGPHSTSIDDVLAPAGAAVAAVFAHTASVANCPNNEEALRKAGDAYGRLVHLLDAQSDRADDIRNGHFNPLEAASMDNNAARVKAQTLYVSIQNALNEAQLSDGKLLHKLLGSELKRAIDKHFNHGAARDHAHHDADSGCAVPSPVVGAAAVAAAVASFGGGGGYNELPPGSGRSRWGRRNNGYYDSGARSRFICVPCCDPCTCCCLCNACGGGGDACDTCDCGC